MDEKQNIDKTQEFDYSGIPPGMREHGLFCLFRKEKRKADSPRVEKIPYRADGRRADSGRRADFQKFEAAVAVYLTGRFDGIGIGALTDIHMIDVDDCVQDGQLDERGRDIVDRLDSYTELSPSGNGIHIFCFAKDLQYAKSRYYINNRKCHVEVYVPGQTNRFLTMTGKCIHGTEVEERSEALQAVLEKYMVRPEAKAEKPKVEAPGSFLSDESVIARMYASKQGEKAKALMEGEVPEGKSESERDMALAQILAFWCGGDLEQMDRIFREYGPVRDKWDRPQSGSTYGMLTLKKAVEKSTAFYQPVVTAAGEDFNGAFAKLCELDPLDNPRYRFGDIGNGRLFADVYKDIARFVPERKKWFIYDGKRWVADIAGLMVMELAKDLADAIFLYAGKIKEELRRGAFKEEKDHWKKRSFRETYIKEAQSVYPLPMDRFDRDVCLFNCDNVTIDLRTKEARPHSAEDYITMISPVVYDPNAYDERFIRFIDEIMSRDREKTRALQKSLGYGLSGLTIYECLFILYGETTRNGKGTLMESVLLIMGDYGKAVRPETITQKRSTDSQAPSEDIARLVGVRFANVAEPKRGLVLDAAQVKSMTGNDTQNARFLHENSFDFKPQYKLYINTNYLPVITDMTIFDSNRIYIIPFNRHFDEEERDLTLKREFAKPETQSAILNWLIDGFQMLQSEGLGKPPAVEQAVKDYRHDSDKTAQFAEERLEPEENAEVRTALLYAEYRKWCDENGCYSENARNFNLELRKFGEVVRRRPKAGGEKTTLLIGYRLRDDFLAPPGE